MYLALSPDAAPTVPARLCLRSGFQCFGDIARALGYPVPLEPDASQGISLTYDDFLKGVKHMRKVDFPIQRDPEDAWPDFVGWRVNYEQAAYAVAMSVHAVPALWSGPRKHKVEQIAPFRPLPGRPTGYQPAKGRAAKGRPFRNHRSAVQEHPAKTHPAKDHPAKEHPAKEHASRAAESQDHEPRDHAAKEHDSAEHAGIDQAGTDLTAGESPRQDATQPGHPSPDNPPA
jgi:hypothetical protein